MLTVGPPLLLALSFPDLFFRALDIAGTYGHATPVSALSSVCCSGTSLAPMGRLAPALSLCQSTAASLFLVQHHALDITGTYGHAPPCHLSNGILQHHIV